MTAVFRHERFGFEIGVPDGWASISDALGCALLLMEIGAEGFRASVTVGVEEPHASDLDALVDDQLAQLATSLTDFDVVERSDTEMAGEPARYVSATYREGIYQIQLEQWVISLKERAVAVAATVPFHRREDLTGAIRSAVESFRVG